MRIIIEAQGSMSILEEKARRGSQSAFLRALKKVDRKTSKPEKADVLPTGYSRQTLRARLKRESGL